MCWAPSLKNGIGNLTTHRLFPELTSAVLRTHQERRSYLECRSGSMVSKAFGSQGSFHLLVQSVQSM